ncbi:hypothetical protein I8748_27395 [Nostoc sp. CENA67]|uniref:Uncharacterized protein n=1 Tax=Amazonocrinis nigriterrae CENA67 TaxID=2794033 RepID=A0A8J7HYL0_9NOST|nr:hypothetical protein [Amazonocrinis nigriterrae]MBH8565848.1 hypothetical protein [Amazonocrinis nigriterrae CENA67]
MKFWKYCLIVLMIFANLAFAQPSFADRPKLSKNPDYIEVTKAIKKLSQVKDAQTQLEGLTPEETQKKIDELEFQKYALETGINWGQCDNQTGKTIAVYGKNPNEEENEDYLYDNGLYFLADGQATRNNWDCDGFYLPNDAKLVGLTPDQQVEEFTEPVAIKIADGNRLTIKRNPETDAIEVNVPNVQIVKANDVNWFIPNVSQALIDTRVPNAPTENS